ncbi:UNVERIFIED_CONTAM: hypothetical protein RMT77_019190 [Armadillidium vulgare]
MMMTICFKFDTVTYPMKMFGMRLFCCVAGAFVGGGGDAGDNQSDERSNGRRVDCGNDPDAEPSDGPPARPGTSSHRANDHNGSMKEDRGEPGSFIEVDNREGTSILN